MASQQPVILHQALIRSWHVTFPFTVASYLSKDLSRRHDVGRVQLRGLGKGLHGLVIAQDKIQHVDQEIRVRCRRAQAFRSDPGLGQEITQPLGLAGEKRKRLNRNDFSDFAGFLSRLFQTRICLSINFWVLF